MLWGGQPFPHLMTAAHCSLCSSQLSLALSLRRPSLGIAGMRPICQNVSLQHICSSALSVAASNATPPYCTPAGSFECFCRRCQQACVTPGDTLQAAKGLCHIQAGAGWPQHRCSPQLQSSLCPVPPYLATVYDAPIGVDALQVAMSVQLRRLVRTPQAEALAPAQQDVQVVVEVMVQPTGGACSSEQPVQE